MIEMIALTVDNFIMSVDGKIPIILKSHLHKIRQQIKGKIVVMGSVTYEGLGEQPFHSAKQVVIISRHKKYPRNVKVVHTVLELITEYKDFIVVGGSTLFADIMPMADRVYMTEVLETAEHCNSFKLFPNMKHMKLSNPNAEFETEGDHYFRFLTYKR